MSLNCPVATCGTAAETEAAVTELPRLRNKTLTNMTSCNILCDGAFLSLDVCIIVNIFGFFVFYKNTTTDLDIYRSEKQSFIISKKDVAVLTLFTFLYL